MNANAIPVNRMYVAFSMCSLAMRVGTEEAGFITRLCEETQRIEILWNTIFVMHPAATGDRPGRPGGSAGRACAGTKRTRRLHVPI